MGGVRACANSKMWCPKDKGGNIHIIMKGSINCGYTSALESNEQEHGAGLRGLICSNILSAQRGCNLFSVFYITKL